MATQPLLPKYLRTNWLFLLQTATWILSAVAGFLLPPPEWSTLWEWLGRFLVAVITGLLLVPIILFARKKYTWRWWIAALFCLFTGLTLVFQYLDVRNDKWTTEYAGHRIVIGWTINGAEEKRIEHYVAIGHPRPDDQELVGLELGDVKKIWHPDEIDARQHALIWMYLGSLVLLTTGLMSLLQAIQCSRSRQR